MSFSRFSIDSLQFLSHGWLTSPSSSYSFSTWQFTHVFILGINVIFQTLIFIVWILIFFLIFFFSFFLFSVAWIDYREQQSIYETEQCPNISQHPLQILDVTRLFVHLFKRQIMFFMLQTKLYLLLLVIMYQFCYNLCEFILYYCSTFEMSRECLYAIFFSR